MMNDERRGHKARGASWRVAAQASSSEMNASRRADVNAAVREHIGAALQARQPRVAAPGVPGRLR